MQRWEKPPPAPAGRERKAAAESLPKQVGAAGAAPEHPGEESGRVQRVMLCKVCLLYTSRPQAGGVLRRGGD